MGLQYPVAQGPATFHPTLPAYLMWCSLRTTTCVSYVTNFEPTGFNVISFGTNCLHVLYFDDSLTFFECHCLHVLDSVFPESLCMSEYVFIWDLLPACLIMGFLEIYSLHNLMRCTFISIKKHTIQQCGLKCRYNIWIVLPVDFHIGRETLKDILFNFTIS